MFLTGSNYICSGQLDCATNTRRAIESKKGGETGSQWIDLPRIVRMSVDLTCGRRIRKAKQQNPLNMVVSICSSNQSVY